MQCNVIDGPAAIKDCGGVTWDIHVWPNFVVEGVEAARRTLWKEAVAGRATHCGIQIVKEGIGAVLYHKKIKVAPMVAGALRTILIDGVLGPWRQESGVRVRGRLTV